MALFVLSYFSFFLLFLLFSARDFMGLLALLNIEGRTKPHLYPAENIYIILPFQISVFLFNFPGN